MVGLVWERAECTYLIFAGKLKAEIETYILSDNDNSEMIDASVRLKDIIENKKYNYSP